MKPNQSGLNDFGPNKSDDISTSIPESVRAWESLSQVASAIRRPSTLPDPRTYHEIVATQAIFELDEKKGKGSNQTILVVPHACTRCRSQKQACSRARPACARCEKAGVLCVAVHEGYQKLPRPRVGRGVHVRDGDLGGSASPPPSPRDGRTGRARTTRVVSGSKRSLSSCSEHDLPRKNMHTKARPQKRRARRSMIASSGEMDSESDASTLGSLTKVTPTVVSTPERPSTVPWKFVNHSRIRVENAHGKPSDAPVPRVWTNSREGLLTIFPELSKSTVGFSWFQFETPVLLLDTNYAQGHWINPTTLSIDLLWDFECCDSDLEYADESDTEEPNKLGPPLSTVQSPVDALDCEVEMMDIQYLCSPSAIGPSTTNAAASASTSDAETLRSSNAPQENQYAHVSCTREETPVLIYPASGDEMESSTKLCPPSLSSLSENSPPSHPHTPPDESQAKQRIPLIKPDEIETLLNSQLRFIPLLVWISKDSELVPCKLPPEYVYLCMGLFFISDLRHTVIQHEVRPVSREVQGRVCWSVTLQWAPGGEDALFDDNTTPSCDTTTDLSPLRATKDLSNPWWFRPANASSAIDDANPSHPRMQIFSCIPLDLLAEFHPSEVFPRGWFCKSCGMINTQQYFRHQICQSTMCVSRCGKSIPPGKADSLSSLRGAYQSGTLVRPTNRIPSVVDTDRALWDDGMHSWSYCVKDGVTLCHVFTGNQEHLQEDAAALLERIQSEVPLRREDRLSPYFIYATKLLQSSDGSETKVPGGTPDCVRIAYYTLRDFAQRYAETDNPRFSEVRMLAWVNSGSKRGGVLRATKYPVVIHCLGSEVVLNFTPKGGYKEVAVSTALDKGKGRAKDDDQTDTFPAEPWKGSSGRQEQGTESRRSSAPDPGVGETRADLEDEDKTAVAMDVVSQCRSSDAGNAATAVANNSHCDSETEVASQEVAKPGEGPVHKKNKVNKDKNRASVPKISMTLVHGDCVVLHGDDFECQVVRFGTTVLVIGFPEET